MPRAGQQVTSCARAPLRLITLGRSYSDRYEETEGGEVSCPKQWDQGGQSLEPRVPSPCRAHLHTLPHGWPRSGLCVFYLPLSNLQTQLPTHSQAGGSLPPLFPASPWPQSITQPLTDNVWGHKGGKGAPHHSRGSPDPTHPPKTEDSAFLSQTGPQNLAALVALKGQYRV